MNYVDEYGVVFPQVLVPDDVRVRQFNIDGVCFAENFDVRLSSGPSIECKVLSNPGTIVGHVVTHSPSFAYSTFGLHVGQRDRLTFFGPSSRNIVALLIDCRKNSPTRGRRLAISFACLPSRKLVIPQGVAHTFDGLASVVTRNDLSVYCDVSNPDWHMVNDNIPFARGADTVASPPMVQTNEQELGLEAAVVFYQLQAKALKGGQHALTVSHPSRANADPRTLPIAGSNAVLPSVNGIVDGFSFDANSFSAVDVTGSWGVVPSTSSCVFDMVEWSHDAATASYWLHSRHYVRHTFVQPEGLAINLEVADRRRASPTFRSVAKAEFCADPRIAVCIPHGVAYRYSFAGRVLARVEYELFLAKEEPRPDLLPIGADRLALSDIELEQFELSPPTQLAPGKLLRFLARKEYEVMHQRSNTSPKM